MLCYNLIFIRLEYRYSWLLFEDGMPTLTPHIIQSTPHVQRAAAEGC